MLKTPEQFLEELRIYCDKRSKEKEPCYMCNSKSNYYEDILYQIEQFQSECKANENN